MMCFLVNFWWLPANFEAFISCDHSTSLSVFNLYSTGLYITHNCWKKIYSGKRFWLAVLSGDTSLYLQGIYTLCNPCSGGRKTSVTVCGAAARAATNRATDANCKHSSGSDYDWRHCETLFSAEAALHRVWTTFLYGSENSVQAAELVTAASTGCVNSFCVRVGGLDVVKEVLA